MQETLQESVLFEMTGEALHVKLFIVNLLEYNLNQQKSLLVFVLLTLHAKLTLTKIFCTKRQVLLFSILLQFH